MKQLNWYQIFGKSNIPDGRTVEPTDDIQIWLNCANIWDKSYTTLAEVLADTDTLLALITSNNAVDYMVRSTTWAERQNLVPTMTDNTHPSGRTFVGGSSDPNAYKAFDGNDSTYITLSYPPAFLGYEFDTKQSIDGCYVNASGTRKLEAYKVQGSDDDVTWTDITGSITMPGTNISTAWFDHSVAYKYIRIYQTSSLMAPDYRSIQFYSASITTSATAMSYIGQNNYCANTLLADATWCNAIVESEYWESVLSPLVPEMTSNTTPSGIASQYGTPSGSAFEAYKAFDRDNTSHAEATFTRNDTWHVRYEFPTAVKCYVGKYIAHNPSSSTFSFTMKMQRSADGVTWTDISGSTTQSISGGNTYSSGKIIFTSFDDAKYYQFCSQPNNYYAAGATEVQFYGREDV